MPSHTTILLIRHGETEYNRSGVIQGHVDSPLTEEGQKQAMRLGERLANFGIDYVCHSDLGRAAQTCELLGLPLKGQTDVRLREICCGIVDGQELAAVRTAHPAHYQSWQQEDPNFGFPDGETFLQVQTRMYEAIRELALAQAGKKIAIVSHGMAIRLFLKKVVQIPLGQPTGWYLRNTSVTRVHFKPDDDWRLYSFGDVAHLDEL